MTLVVCEECRQRVIRMFRVQNGPDRGRWRVARHKTQMPHARGVWIDWCPGKFEARGV